MTRPKQRLTVSRGLDAAVDERVLRSAGSIDIRHDNGAVTPGTLSGGGSVAGGAGDEPAFPQSFVTSLQLASSGIRRSGEVLLAAAEPSTLQIEDVSASNSAAFEWRSASLLAVDALPATGAADLIYKRKSDNTLWWDRSAAGEWTQLDVNGLDLLVKVSSNDTTSGLLGGKLTAGAGISLTEVDDGANESLRVDSVWSRAGGTLSPAGAGDGVEVAVSGTQPALILESEDGEALVATCLGSGIAVRGVSSDAQAADFISFASHGLIAGSFSSEHYSIVATECIHCGAFLDLLEQSSAPDAPTNGSARLYVDEAGRAELRDDAGRIHDLSVQHSQSFPASSGRSGAASPAFHVLLNWDAAAFPAVAAAAAVSGSGCNSTFTLPTGAGYALLSDAFARFEWTSASGLPGQVTSGAQLALAQSLRRRGGTASVRARLRLNNKDRFSRVELSLNDAGLSSASSGNLLSSISSASWFEAELEDIDITAWGQYLRIVLSAQGTIAAAQVGLTQLDLEFLEIRMWEH